MDSTVTPRADEAVVVLAMASQVAATVAVAVSG